MSEQYDALYCRIHDYMTSELEGAATTRQRRDFAELLLHSESARQIYVAYTQEQTSLRWSYANQPFDLFDQAMHEALASNAATTELSARTTDRILSRAIAAVLTAAVVLAGVSTWLNFGQSRFRGWIGDGGAASSVAVADEATGDAVGSHSDPPARTAVATVTRVIDVKWAAGATPPAELSRLRPGQTLDLLTGRVELLFDTGVELILEGQTHFKVLSSGSGFSQHGSIAARVGEEARGFTIETPSARVIDLGTEFGVTISESGETEVAVFRGIVDLTLDGADHTSDQSVTKRLNQGEALRVGNNGQFHRVFAVASDRFPSSSPDHLSKRGRPALISDVRDNMRDPESRKFYKIVRSGLHEDAPAFVDRNHQWNGVDERGIPPQLLGAEYVMPFNDDKQFSSRLEVTLFVARPITLYIFLSDAVSTPEWLLRGEFVDTGEDIGLDEGPSRWHPASTGRRKLAVGAGKGINTVFSIWKREVPVPSQVVVGGVERPADINGFNMYGIAAVPMD